MRHASALPLETAPPAGLHSPAVRPPGEAACPVCSGHDLDCDEVSDGRPLWLAECRRCQHRWTARPAPGPEVRSSAVDRPGRGGWRRAEPMPERPRFAA